MKYVGDTIVHPKRSDDDSGFRIPIRAYHRAAVGIFPGTKLFLLPIPKTRDLIVTPIEPKKWGDLWKLQVSLKDEPGAAKAIVDILVQNKINILIQEGLSDYAYNGGFAHRVLLVVDLANYNSTIDGNTNHRNTVERPSLRPNQLITSILANAIDYLYATPAEDKWDFSFERMEFFYRNKEHRTGSDQVYLNDNHTIQVPDSVVHQAIYAHAAHNPVNVACHIISDTEEKYLKVRFLDSHKSCFLIRIEHAEITGAIQSFMTALKKKRVNISSSYSRVASMNELAVWYAFGEVEAHFAQNDLKDLLSEISALEDVKRFTLLDHYGFKFDVSAYVNSLALDRYQATAPAAQPKKAAPVIFKEKYRETETALGVRPFYAGQNWKPEPDNIFIAMPFDLQYEGFYQKNIRGAIEGCGLQAVRIDKGKFPDPRMPVTEMIKSNIATSRFVVADVTGFKANVLYEVGLAHAIGKRVLIICEEKYRKRKGLLFDISPYPHLFYSPYELESFTDELRNRIRAMKDHIEGP